MTNGIHRQSALEELCRHAQDEPDRLMMRFLDSGEDYSYRALLDGVLLWAGAFARLGVEAGTAVATMVPVSPEGYLTWLGVAWLRGVEVPVNLDYRGALLVHVLNSSGARVVVCSSEFSGRIVEVADQVPSLETMVVIDDGEVVAGPWQVVRRDEFFEGVTPVEEGDPPGPGDVAAVVYTSGTTGPSKGVIVPWRLMNSLQGYPPEATGERLRIFSPWPLFHVTGKMAFTGAVIRQGSSVIRRRWSTDAFWSDIRENDVTATLILGGMTYFLWSRPARDDDAENPLVWLSMGPVIPEFREFEERFGVEVWSGYASSEAGMPTVAYHPFPNGRTCGRLRPEYEIKLIDEDGNEVGPNVPGEALVRSTERELMSLGYWNMPEATEKAWAEGWFHSGDGLKRDDEGLYYFVDRVKDSLRRRGENVSSQELESIVNTHPAVAESAAIGVPASAVDDDIMIVVVAAAGGGCSAAELVEYLTPRTPKFMIPRYVRFVDELPKTITGRVQKVKLREAGLTADVWDRDVARVAAEGAS
jgi:carnitine-CoA ligase